jgi:hypothetical protein
MFFVIYGLSRFAVEFVRQPDAQFVTPRQPLGLRLADRGYGLTMGQILSLPMIALGLWLILRARQGPRHDRPDGPACSRRSRHGPDDVAEYMAECLLHPEHGYYTTRDPLGRGGRFHHRARDQPDVRRADRPVDWRRPGWIRARRRRSLLAELGPGRGTLMADALRATRGVPGFHAAMHLHLVEASPPCARCRHARAHTISTWHEAEDLPGRPFFAGRQRVLRRAADPAVPARRARLARAHGRARTATLTLGLAPPAAARRARAPPRRYETTA